MTTAAPDRLEGNGSLSGDRPAQLEDRRRCIGCGTRRTVGELLLVRPLNPMHGAFTVCRPTIDVWCLHRFGGRAHQTRLEMLDAGAAAAYDRARFAQQRAVPPAREEQPR